MRKECFREADIDVARSPTRAEDFTASSFKNLCRAIIVQTIVDKARFAAGKKIKGERERNVDAFLRSEYCRDICKAAGLNVDINLIDFAKVSDRLTHERLSAGYDFFFAK